MAKKIIIAAGATVAAVVVLCLYIASFPDSFRIERASKMEASSAVVFTNLTDFHRWNDFSPWAKLDPNMKQAFEGPPSGVGAKYTWSGDSQVGEGEMSILEATPDEHVGIALVFKKPFEANNRVDFKISRVDPKTIQVSWAMSGAASFVHKAMGLFWDMDAMIGDDFEKGLSDLKAMSEAETKKQETANPPAPTAPAAPGTPPAGALPPKGVPAPGEAR